MDWNEEVSDLGMRFCRSVGLRGLLNVEFKRDSRDGRLTLIEANHRFTASSALHLAAGLDVPLFVYNRLTGAPLPQVGRPYKEGITLWYPLDDYRAFKDYRRGGEITAMQYLRSVAKRQTFSVASLTDPGPLLLALKPRVRGLWRRVRSRMGFAAKEPRAPVVDLADVEEPEEVRTPAGTRS
jgi:D-aspartate ligase